MNKQSGKVAPRTSSKHIADINQKLVSERTRNAFLPQLNLESSAVRSEDEEQEVKMKFEEVLETDFLHKAVKLEGNTSLLNCKKDHS